MIRSPQQRLLLCEIRCVARGCEGWIDYWGRDFSAWRCCGRFCKRKAGRGAKEERLREKKHPALEKNSFSQSYQTVIIQCQYFLLYGNTLVRPELGIGMFLILATEIPCLDSAKTFEVCDISDGRGGHAEEFVLWNPCSNQTVNVGGDTFRSWTNNSLLLQ